ncbi:MAG TPA: alpha/beta hydrolase [Vicinamibacterales bacterium]|nr:alpha/beta hydrolase [Vicinamibacterales bacterium]
MVGGVGRTGMFLLSLLALGQGASGQPCPPLQVGNPDGNYIVPGVQGAIPYSGGLALDAYVQPGPDRRPAVVVIHGGGWTSGSRIAHVGQLLEMVTRAGYHWFSVDYRLAGAVGIEQSLADVRAALAFIRCHAREFKVDPARVLLLGEDAGADLASMLAVPGDDGVLGAVLIGGIYEPGGTADALTGVAAGAHAPPGRQRPAVFMIHGGADRDVPVDRARRVCSALAQARHRCEFLEVAGASHRVENWWPSQWSYKRAVVAWLSALAPAGPAPVTAPGGPLRKDIVYARSPEVKLDAFVPPAAKPGPGVILVHGGGWEAGDKVTYITPLFEPLARAGLAWVSIEYRLTPAFTHEDQLEDLRRAIRFVRTEHARFNIDPARIVLVGESASGQMVTRIAAEDRSLSGVVSFYGVYDLPAMVTDASPRSLLVRLFRRTVLDDEARALLRSHSPLYLAHSDMPPVLLVNGTADPLTKQAHAYASRLTELGVRHDVIQLEGAPHGMENWEGHDDWMIYKRRVVDWIAGLFR